MNREIYENMAEGMANQLKDLLSGATYDQKDAFIDCLDAVMMDTSSESACESLKDAIFDIYSLRIENEEGDAGSLLELSLGEPLKKNESVYEDIDCEIAEDDFLFSL